jgi:hypothetical protein
MSTDRSLYVMSVSAACVVCTCRSGRSMCKGPKAVCEVVNTDRKIDKGEFL